MVAMTHPRESRLWAHVWMALYRPDVQWSGPFPATQVMHYNYNRSM